MLRAAQKVREIPDFRIFRLSKNTQNCAKKLASKTSSSSRFLQLDKLGKGQREARVICYNIHTLHTLHPPPQTTHHPSQKKYPSKPLDVYLHPECAAEWGMQLIKDALEANCKVGRRLSNREIQWEHYYED